MNTFEIKSFVLGTERKILVTEPANVDGTEFILNLEEKEQIVIKFDNGNWYSLLPDKTIAAVPKQLEIDSIGFEIAKHWCSRLATQLESFRLSI